MTYYYWNKTIMEIMVNLDNGWSHILLAEKKYKLNILIKITKHAQDGAV